MPRINVEDKWFCDPRREALIAKIGKLAADGCALGIWKIAQEYYRLETLVPKDIYFECAHAMDFIAVRLAEEREDGVYIKGSKELFDWIYLRKEAGRKGGLAKVSKSKQNVANPSKSKQTQASSSSSSSSSNKKEDVGEKFVITDSAKQAFDKKWGKEFVDATLPLVLNEIAMGNPKFEETPKIVRVRQMLQKQYATQHRAQTSGKKKDVTKPEKLL